MSTISEMTAVEVTCEILRRERIAFEYTIDKTRANGKKPRGNWGEKGPNAGPNWPKHPPMAIDPNPLNDAPLAQLRHGLEKHNLYAVAKALHDPSAVLLSQVEVDGEEDWKRWKEFAAPSTLGATSSSEYKRHYYYASPPGATIHKWEFKDGALTTWKNGVLIMPPSTNVKTLEEDGEDATYFYTWHNPEQAIVELPAEIDQALWAEYLKREKKINEVLQTGEKTVSKGFRHTFLRSLCGRQARMPGTKEGYIAAVLDAYHNCVVEPEDAKTLLFQIEDMWRRWHGDATDPMDMAFDVPEPPVAPRRSSKRPKTTDDGLAEGWARDYGSHHRYILEKDKKEGYWLPFDNELGRFNRDGGLQKTRRSITTFCRELAKNYASDIDLGFDPSELSKEELKEKRESLSVDQLGDWLYKEAAQAISNSKLIKPWRDGIISHAEGLVMELHSALNSNPYLLSVGEGLVLEGLTGNLRPGRPEDMLTVGTDVPFDPDAESGLWEETVWDILRGKDRIIRAVQAHGGLALFGDVSDEMFLLLHGPSGRNGKGTITGPISSALGPLLAAEVPSEYFSAGVKYVNTSGPDPLTSSLRYTRMIRIEEIHRFNIDKLKKYSGGGRISTRSHHQEQYEYPYQFHLWFEVNTAPTVPPDGAFAGRLVYIPFTQRYTQDNGRLDSTRKPTLIREMEHRQAVLAWCWKGWQDIQACASEQERKDLLRPPELQAAAAQYLVSVNVLTPFIDAYCEAGDGYATEEGAIWAVYSQDYLPNVPGVHQLTRPEFFEHLQALGYELEVQEMERVWKGIHIRSAQL
jgi:hypothetical protein